MKVFVFLLSFFIFNSFLGADEKECLLKGVVLEKISQFIDYNESLNEFKICVYGDDELVKVFVNLYNAKEYNGTPIKVYKISSIYEIGHCDILYATKLKESLMKQIILKKYKKTLLVTDDISFISNGFMIALFFENNKLKFAINKFAIKEADLKVNYRLLKVASKVVNVRKE